MRAARSFDMPLSLSASYCFSFLTLGRLSGMARPLSVAVGRRFPVQQGLLNQNGQACHDEEAAEAPRSSLVHGSRGARQMQQALNLAHALYLARLLNERLEQVRRRDLAA